MDLEKKSKQEDNMSDELCPACKMIGIEKKKSEHSKNDSYPVRFNFVSSTDRLGVDMKIYLLLFLWIVSGLCVSQAFGYVENVQLETADGRQIFASATNPSTVTAPIGFIHGILQVSSVPVLDSTLKDFVSTETRQADDTTQVVFDGIVVQNQTSVIRVLTIQEILFTV